MRRLSGVSKHIAGGGFGGGGGRDGESVFT